MRIVVLNDHASITGGADQVAIASLNALADVGFDVTFIAAVGPVDPSIDCRRVNVVNLGFHDLLGNPSRISAAVHGLWDLRCAARVGALLKGFDPRDTVVHLHTWVKSLSSSVVREALRRGFRVVCTLHDYFSVCPNGGLYDYRQRRQCDLRPMSGQCVVTNCDSRSYSHKLWRVGRHAMQKSMGGIPDGIAYFISVSEYSEALLRPLLPAQAKIFRVRNPIDVEQAAPADPAGNDRFCFIGRLAPEKGATIFAEASKLAGVRAVFVGTGPEERSIMAANSRAELLGWQNREGVCSAIRASRAVAFPSLWHETQGLAVTEAAALGVPAIVSNACAARDTVRDGETGLLFKAGDVQDLKEKLLRLSAEPHLAGRLGKNAYDRYWVRPSTLEIHVKELSDCYLEMMGDVH